MRVNKKAILDTIEWAKTALANGMRVPPVPTSQVTEDILFKRAVVVALWAFWKPEQFQRQQGAGRWKAETPTINKVLSLLQTIDNVPVLDVQVDNDGMLHVKLIGAGVEHTEEDVDGDDDPDALWYTFIYAAFTPDMIAKITGNREKKFATWGYVHSIGGPQFGLGVLKAKTSCVTVRKDGAARPVYGAVVALTNDELDKMLKVALRETGVPHVLATLGVTTKGVKGAQQMYVPVPAPGGAPNGGAGGTRDFEAQDADAAASVRKTVDSLTALPAAADAYLQLLKPQQGGQGAVFGVGASKPSVAEEVPTPAEPRFRMSPSAWESWKPKSKQQSALLDYLRMLFKSTDKINRPIFDAVIDRMHKALVSGGNKTGFTFSQIGDIVQRADMDSIKGSSFTQQALDFLLADVSGYANSLYEELRAKSELTDADIDSAEAIITALYPANLLYPNDDIKDVLSVKQMSDLGINLGNVRDSINALVEESPASTLAIEDPTYPLGRVPSGESESYFHGSIVEVDFARHLNHTDEDIREGVVRYAYRNGALLEVAVETNGKTQNARVPGTSVVRVLELVTNPVNNTDSTAPVSTNATVFKGLTSKELADRATSVGLPQLSSHRRQ